MTSIVRVCVLAAGLALVGTAAIAQSNDTMTTDTDVSRRNGTLSDKLNATSGVIHPQENVDPGIHKPAPATGTMPVLPPPGTAGGNPDVQPK